MQLFSFGETQIDQLKKIPKLPKNLTKFISSFESKINTVDDGRYSYRVIYSRTTANHNSQADTAYRYADESEDPKHQSFKEVEKPKYLPNEIVKEVKERGYSEFSLHKHTQLWQAEKAKDPKKSFGTSVAKQWYWYQNWLDHVLEHCKKPST